ncbi:MAG TPA: hypothetical protein VFQ44_23630 [Streptosporangiaceae bacterium]|nr:hypothetical protein [Streptosporangiaceae bacterium]
MRIGDGGGWGAITGDTYQIKTMAVTPASASGMKAQEIEALFSYLDPSAVAEAGHAHAAAARTLVMVAESLIAHAQALSGGWNGTAAQASVAAFRQLHATAVQLAQASAQTGEVLTWLGETILPYYKNWKAPSNGIMGTVESFFGSNPQDHAAQQVMERLNDRLSQANAGLPASVSFTPPKIGGTGHAAPASSGSGPNGGVGAAVASSRLAGGVGGPVSPASGSERGITAVGGGNPGPGGSLGLVPTAPGGGGHTLPPTHLAGFPLGGGTPPGVGGLPGGGGGLPGGGLPGGGLPGGGGGLPGGTGSGGGGVILSGPGPAEPMPGPGQGSGPGAGGDPVEGTPPGEVGAFPGGPGGYGAPGSSGDEGAPGGPSLVGEDAAFQSDPGAFMGSDGMIGTGPGMTEGEFGSRYTGATGFIGDDSAQPGEGLPMAGGSGNGRRENDRYRQAWMTEDLDTWEGPAA